MNEEISQFSLKYRPRKWQDIYGQDNTVKALKTRLKDNKIPSVILFKGQFGTGKTTCAELFAACLVSDHLDEDYNPNWECPACKSILNQTFDRDVIRLDGASLSGKDDVINIFKDINMRPLFSTHKVVIIEECDQISSAGKLSLLKTLEGLKPWVTVILLSMEDNGISPSLKSRCQVYNIKPIQTADMMMCLKSVMEKSGYWTNEDIPNSFRLEGLKTIASAAQGCLRDAVQYLEQCIVNKAWTSDQISELLEVIDEVATWKILDLLLEKSNDEAMWRKLIHMKTGEDTMKLYNYMCVMLSEGLIYKTTGVSADDSNKWRMDKMSKSPNLDSLYYCLTLHPQMSKPFIRTSDLLGCLACYYQGYDFRPKTQQERTNEMLKGMTSVALNEVPQRLREEVSNPVRNIVGHQPTQTIENPEPPKSKPAYRPATRKVEANVSRLEIKF